MFNIIQKTRFSCLASFLLCVPLYGAHLLDVGDEKEGYKGTVGDQLPAQNAIIGNEAQVQREVFDYTDTLNLEINHLVDELDDDTQDDLEASIDFVKKKLTNERHTLLLGAILQNTKTNTYYKYLFFSSDVMQQEQKAINRTHKKYFHLIQGKSPHDVLQLFGWLHLTKKYSVKALYPSRPVCRNCRLFALHLFEIDLATNEKGCLGIDFPVSNQIPRWALAYINSHLTLPLVEKLIVPMMGYVSGKEVEAKDQQIANLSRQLEQKNTSLQQKDGQLRNKDQELATLNTQVEAKKNQLQAKDQQIANLSRQLEQKNTSLQQKDGQLRNKDQELATLNTQVEAKDQRITTLSTELNEKKEEIEVYLAEIDRKEAQLRSSNQEIGRFNDCLTQSISHDIEYAKKLIANRYDSDEIEVFEIDYNNEQDVRALIQKVEKMYRDFAKQVELYTRPTPSLSR